MFFWWLVHVKHKTITQGAFNSEINKMHEKRFDTFVGLLDFQGIET